MHERVKSNLETIVEYLGINSKHMSEEPVNDESVSGIM